MRTLTLPLLAVFCLGAADTVRAADLDYDYLRGAEYEAAPAPLVDWSGVYLGGHGGYSATRFDFGHAGRSDIAHILQYTTIETEFGVSSWNRLATQKGHGGSYGAFGGYNVYWDGVILGVEADYTSLFQKAVASNSIDRYVTLSNGTFANVFTSIASKATIEDYGTVRARAGYAFGSILPYVTGGLSFGRAIVGSRVLVVEQEYADATRAVQTGGIIRPDGRFKEKFSLGFALGVGVDYAVTSNVFLRAEYQYVNLGQFGDHKLDVNTVRGAVGVKF